MLGKTWFFQFFHISDWPAPLDRSYRYLHSQKWSFTTYPLSPVVTLTLELLESEITSLVCMHPSLCIHLNFFPTPSCSSAGRPSLTAGRKPCPMVRLNNSIWRVQQLPLFCAHGPSRSLLYFCSDDLVLGHRTLCFYAAGLCVEKWISCLRPHLIYSFVAIWNREDLSVCSPYEKTSPYCCSFGRQACCCHRWTKPASCLNMVILCFYN